MPYLEPILRDETEDGKFPGGHRKIVWQPPLHPGTGDYFA